MSRVPLRLLLVLAARSLWAHKVKSLIVGSILFFGTFLVVLGGALLSSVQDSMTRSITGSMSGHLQIYAADAEDELALFGGMGMGTPNYGEIPNFADAAGALSDVENVADIVPMGITTATIFGPSELDRVLEKLRAAIEADDAATRDAAIPQIRGIARSLLDEQSSTQEVVADKEKLAEAMAHLERVDSDVFWQTDFVEDPEAAVTFIDSEIAPLAGDGRMMFLRVIGTDTEQFSQSFDRFYIVDGEAIPPGRRGFLFSKRTYEEIVKNQVARELDGIREEVVEDGAVIADDTLLQERIARNARQYARVTYGLEADAAAAIDAALRQELPDLEGDLDARVQALLMVDDATLERRYAFFYEQIAPHIRLYDMPVGAVIPLRAFTRSGYVRSINVKVYGTYEFRGLERSGLASASNVSDVITFRELYGKMNSEQLAELDEIRTEVGVQDVSRADAEDALFGGDGDLEEAVEETVAGEGAAMATIVIDDGSLGRGAQLDDRVYTSDEIRGGLAINAAVLLDDPSRLWETKAALEARIAERGLNLQVVDWQTASGIVGQFLYVVQAVLIIALLVIFLVALLIINNSMVLATLDRTAEIGTMRAIGARRGLVVALFMGETVLLGVIAGLLGALAGAGVVAVMGQVGIPAFHEVLVLLFAGPRLYPSVSVLHIAFGIASVVSVGVVSTLYPALLAARVQPVVAMQSKG